VISKEFERSNLALELKAGKKRWSSCFTVSRTNSVGWPGLCGRIRSAWLFRDLISEWKAVLGGPYSTGAAIRWRTVRVWKQRVVIAERIEALAWVDQQGT